MLPAMPQTALNKGLQPAIDGLHVISKLDDGMGAGRFDVRTDDVDRAELLIHDPEKLSRDQFLAWVHRLDDLRHRSLPDVLQIEDKNDAAAFALFSSRRGKTLEQAVVAGGKALGDLEALTTIMQIASALQCAHEVGLAHGQLTADSVHMVKSETGIMEIHLSHWRPLRTEVDVETAQSHDLEVLGQLFYLMLTGVMPPSTQSAQEEGLEGDSTEAFDDLLIDWIEEDRELGGMGEAALKAIASGEAFESVAQFLEAILPHFRERLGLAIEAAATDLDKDREFMREVEQQRAKLQELKSRQRFIEDWLDGHVKKINESEARQTSLKSRVDALQNLEVEVALTLGQSCQFEEDPRLRWQALSANELSLDAGPTSQGSALPLGNQTDTDTISEKAVDAPETSVSPSVGNNPERYASPTQVRSTMVMALGIVAAIIGALLAAGMLSGWPGPEGKHVVAEKPVKSTNAQTPPVSKDTMKGQQELMVSARQTPGPENGKKQPTRGMPVKQETQGSLNSHQEPLTTETEPNVSESSTAAPSEQDQPAKSISPVLPAAPDGMVTVSGGWLFKGLTPTQANNLMGECKKTKHAYHKKKCEQIGQELLGSPQSMAGFFIDRTEVSQGSYDRCTQAGVCMPIRTRWDVDYQPATGVTFQMAKTFCEWRKSRLPTRDEWLYAARGSKDSRVFPWGDSLRRDDKTANANLGDNARRGGVPDRSDRHKYVGSVEIFPESKSPFGTINQVGNVREWVANSDGGAAGSMGGGWRSPPFDARLSNLRKISPESAVNDLGFRCVVDADQF